MKKRLLIGLGVIIFVVMIVILVIFVRGVIKDNKDSSDRILKIGKLNEKMEENIQDYNLIRNDLTVLLQDTYTDELNDKYEDISSLLNREEKSVKQVKDIVSSLDKQCAGKIYSDSSINEVCLVYKVTYEEMVNVFISDVGHINHMITSYNENQTNLLDEYHSVDFKDYIDYNGDGNYSGKEE